MYVCLHECVCICVCMYTYTIALLISVFFYLIIHAFTSICQIGFVSIYIYHFYNQSNLIDLRVQKANRYMSE